MPTRWVGDAREQLAQAGKGFYPQVFVCHALPQEPPPADNYFDLLSKIPFPLSPPKTFLAA